nr:hypothetical protein [Tanacetum cinerariifolium]
MEECHLLLTDQFDLLNPEGDKERRNALSISKLKATYYPDFELKELVQSLWIDRERDYDISTAYVQRVEDLQLGIESYKTKLNLTQPRWDATDFLFKEDYTIVYKPRAVIYRDRNNQKKMMRETEVHKFSDGTLTRILEKLDVMVKDYVLFKFNPGMNRIWFEVDRRRSKDFIEAIERRLKIQRILRRLECFVGGRFRDVDSRTLNRTE